MDLDGFWQLTADALEHATGRSAREGYFEDRLAALDAAELVAFQVFLDRACDEALTWDLWGAAMRIFGGWCSDDGFEYFRLWLIGRGRPVFERAVAAPDSLAEDPAIIQLIGRHRRDWDDDEDWPAWERLDYLAAEAHGMLPGTGDAHRDVFYDVVETRLGTPALRRDPVGERWDTRDEATAAQRIPLLTARFPIDEGLR